MASELAGKSALITGGGGGFGAASAKLLARDGAAVMLMGRSADRLESAAADILAAYPDARVSTHAGDANAEEDVRAAIAACVERFGSLDIVVSTVGVAIGGKVAEVSTDAFMDEVDRNLRPAVLLVNQAVPMMGDGGAFVFISSMAAQAPAIGTAAYSVAKAALDHFMRCAANELGSRGFRFNCVRPGLTRTPSTPNVFANPERLKIFVERIPLGRPGLPEEIAHTVRHLVGPESSWTTGQSFAIDGGNEIRGAPMP